MTTEAPPAWRIVFYKDARGHDPIEEYLNRMAEVPQEGLDDERYR